MRRSSKLKLVEYGGFLRLIKLILLVFSIILALIVFYKMRKMAYQTIKYMEDNNVTLPSNDDKAQILEKELGSDGKDAARAAFA